MQSRSNFIAAALVVMAGLLPMPAAAQQGAAPVSAIAGFTAAQVTAGRAAYQAGCQDCHGANLDDGEFGGPALRGKNFQAHWFGKPASNLVRFAFNAMPPDAPGRMPLENYSEIIAYILSVNGMSAGAQPLPGDVDSLSKLIIPAFTP